MERREIDVSLITPNKGQVPGLPRNPRLVKKERYEATRRSIEESPEMLNLRELIVVEYMEDRYVVVCGNLRLRACKELGYKTVPCKVLPGDTPAKKLREYAAKDKQPKQKDKFRERFDAMDNDSAVYPLIPKYDEKHELFIIQSSNEVDSNWLREILDMQHMRSYKTGKVSKSNVISIKDFREAITKAQKGEAS